MSWAPCCSGRSTRRSERRACAGGVCMAGRPATFMARCARGGGRSLCVLVCRLSLPVSATPISSACVQASDTDHTSGSEAGSHDFSVEMQEDVNAACAVPSSTARDVRGHGGADNAAAAAAVCCCPGAAVSGPARRACCRSLRRRLRRRSYATPLDTPTRERRRLRHAHGRRRLKL